MTFGAAPQPDDPRRRMDQSKGEDLSLQTLAKTAGSDAEGLLAELLNKADEATAAILREDPEGPQALSHVISNAIQEKEVALLGVMLLREIKTTLPREDQVSLEHELIESLTVEENPHRKHCYSLALQGSLPETTQRLLSLLEDDEQGDYVSVTLRGSSSPAVTERLQQVFEDLEEKGPLYFRAVSALFGSSKEQVSATIGNSLNPGAASARTLLSYGLDGADSALQAHIQSTVRTLPFATDAFLSEDPTHPVALISSNPANILKAHQFPTQHEDQEVYGMKISIDKDSNLMVTGLLPHPVNGLYAVTAVVQFLSRHDQETRKREYIEKRKQVDIDPAAIDFNEIAISTERREAFAQAIAQIPINLDESVREHSPELKHELAVLKKYTAEERGKEESAVSLDLGDLVSTIVDVKKPREAKFAAAKLLGEARFTTDLEEAPTEAVMLDVVTGVYDDFTKHVAALAIQGTRQVQTLEKLADLFFDPDLGDFAAVALRGSQHPIVTKTIAKAVKNEFTSIVERGALTALHTREGDIGSVVRRTAALRGIYTKQPFRSLLRFAVNRPGMAQLLERFSLGQRFRAYVNDDEAALALGIAANYTEYESGDERFLLKNTHYSLPLKSSLYRNLEEDSFIGRIAGTPYGLHAVEDVRTDRLSMIHVLSPSHGAVASFPAPLYLNLPILAHVNIENMLDGLRG